MPLQNTLDLLSQYGQKLIGNSITDDELKQLMDKDSFKEKTNSEIYPKTSYSDADYQSLHAIKRNKIIVLQAVLSRLESNTTIALILTRHSRAGGNPCAII